MELDLSQVYIDPKPLLNLRKPLLEWSISSKLRGKYYVIVNGLEKQYIKTLEDIKNKYFLDLEIIDIKQSTRGQAETCLIAIKEFSINTEDQLIITNCDQFMESL